MSGLHLPGSDEARVDEACLWIRVGAPGAARTLERLLLLGRDDVTIAEVEDGPERAILVFVSRPPLYLLLRVRDEVDEGVTAFVASTLGAPATGAAAEVLWVEWGHRHPLERSARAALARSGHVGFLSGSGVLRDVAAPLALRSIHDALSPVLPLAAAATLAPAPGVTRFPVRIRLVRGADVDPELWLFDAERLLALEDLLRGGSPDDAGRLTLGRVCGPDTRPRYVLREIQRPGAARLGTRVADLLGQPGFARAAGTDNLYLPVGRRLFPQLPREAGLAEEVRHPDAEARRARALDLAQDLSLIHI